MESANKMIGYIKGKIEEIGLDYILIENNGIGYKMNVSANTITQIGMGENVKIYSKMIVREDDISLCGFYTKEEQIMFDMLTSVSKIGTKVGLSILSYASPQKLSQYIVSGDIISLSKAPGVGKKTAERMVLELKDKVSKLGFGSDSKVEDDEIIFISNQSDGEAIEALIALGYTKAEAEEAVSFTRQPGMGVEDVVKKALEYIMKTNFKF